jgi:hypothetical protein
VEVKAVRKVIQSLLAALTLVVAQGVHASAASAPTTPSLTGETLTLPVGGVTPNSPHCSADGTGYVTFDASGDAAGPYSGTFRERGALVITLQGGLYYEHFFAVFTIKSVTPRATIRGTKAEIPPETFPPAPGFACQDYSTPPPSGYGTFGNLAPNIYQATIRTNGNGSDHTYRDNGVTDSGMLFTCLPSGCPAGVAAFFENFTSSRGPLLYPTNDGGD